MHSPIELELRGQMLREQALREAAAARLARQLPRRMPLLVVLRGALSRPLVGQELAFRGTQPESRGQTALNAG